jgi:hypothetical protein
MEPPEILDRVAECGHAVFTRGAWNLNVIGVRTPSRQAGKFDDRIHLVFRDGFGRWVDLSFPCTTDPGIYWLNRSTSRGTAILKAGQYRGAYRMGLHKSRYPALVQRKPVTVWRDRDRDGSLDFIPGTERTGMYGINIHHAGVVDRAGRSGDDVGPWSAGCTVLSSIDDWSVFMSVVQRSAELYGETFTYTLIEE